MFSRRTVLIVVLLVLVALDVVLLSIANRKPRPSYELGSVAISMVAPFQELITHTIRFSGGIWENYFALASLARENRRLSSDIDRYVETTNECRETSLANDRLRDLLQFKKRTSLPVVAAEVIGKDPSPWFRTIMIDKGRSEGVRKGLPVLVPTGICGQVVDASWHYAKVLLITDQNSAVDAIIQRTRSRGIVKGDPRGQCQLKYALRKHDITVGDTVVSSGLDNVFPKGLRLGEVSSVVKRSSGIFQEVAVTPFVNFEELEEVLVVMLPEQEHLDESE